MAYIWIALGCNLILVYVIRRYMQLFFPESVKSSIATFLVYAFCYVVTMLVYLFWQIPVLNGLTNLLCIFVITLFYSGKIQKKVLVSILITSTNAVADMIMSAIMFPQYEGFEFENIGFIYSTLFICLCEITIEKVTKLRRNVDIVPNHCGILMIIPLCSIYLLYCVTNTYLPKRYLLGVCISVLVINIVSFYIYDRLLESFLKQKQQEFMEIKFQAYSNQLDIIMEEERKIQALRHDMKHHIIELLSIANKGNWKRQQKYLYDMQKAMQIDDQFVLSGNKEIDGITNYYIKKAKALLSKVAVKIDIPDNLGHFQYDFSVIIGNLLDNAIIASVGSIEKSLSICIEYRKGIMFINIANSYSGAVDENRGKFVSKKDNKLLHGLGIENVKNTIKKYNGSIKIQYVDKIFQVDIILYCEIQ